MFIQFMLLLGKIERLPVDFHKYYTLYKFFEFVHELNLGINENYAICCKQAVIVSCYKNGSKADLNNLVWKRNFYTLSDELSIVCSTCCHHKILLTVGHPISNVIKEVLLEKLNNGLEYPSALTDTQVENIVNFLEYCGLNKSFQQNFPTINDIQQKAAYSKPLLGLKRNGLHHF